MYRVILKDGLNWTVNGASTHARELIAVFQFSARSTGWLAWARLKTLLNSSHVLLWYTWSARAFAFTQTAYLLKLVIPTTTNALPRWRLNVETKTKRTLHSSRRLSFNELTNAKNLVLHSSHFAVNWRCCTAVLGERSSGDIWKLRTSSFKYNVDHSHTMYISGNIDVRIWVHLLKTRCKLVRWRKLKPITDIFTLLACWRSLLVTRCDYESNSLKDFDVVWLVDSQATCNGTSCVLHDGGWYRRTRCLVCYSFRAFSYIRYINQQMYTIKYNKSANHKIRFLISIKTLHVSAPECQPQVERRN